MPERGFVNFPDSIPLYVSGFGPRSLGLAGALGDGGVTVLDPGETANCPRVREECGPFAMASLHFAHDQWRQLDKEPPAFCADAWDDYCAMLAEIPPYGSYGACSTERRGSYPQCAEGGGRTERGEGGALQTGPVETNAPNHIYDDV